WTSRERTCAAPCPSRPPARRRPPSPARTATSPDRHLSGPPGRRTPSPSRDPGGRSRRDAGVGDGGAARSSVPAGGALALDGRAAPLVLQAALVDGARDLLRDALLRGRGSGLGQQHGQPGAGGVAVAGLGAELLGADRQDAAHQTAGEALQRPRPQVLGQGRGARDVEGQLGRGGAGVDVLPARPRGTGETPAELGLRDRDRASDVYPSVRCFAGHASIVAGGGDLVVRITPRPHRTASTYLQSSSCLKGSSRTTISSVSSGARGC